MQITAYQLRFDEASAPDTAPNAAWIRMFTLIGKLTKATTTPRQTTTKLHREPTAGWTDAAPPGTPDPNPAP